MDLEERRERDRKLSKYIGFPLNTTCKTWAVNHCVGRTYYRASIFLLSADESGLIEIVTV